MNSYDCTPAFRKKSMKKIFLIFLIFILLVNNASAYTFTNIGRDFKIEYPTGWTYTEEQDGSDQTFTSQTGHGWVRVAVVSSDGMNLDDIVGERIRYLNGLGIYPFSEKYVTINGVADKVKELMFYEDYQQKEYKERQILALSGDKYYIITAGSATTDFAFYSEDFDRIINSFSIIQPSIATTTTGAISTPPPATPTPEEETDEILSSDVASIALHREKTKVDVGEEVLLKLSIVNYISNREPMEVQLILAPPSGMSITSTEFTQSTTGQSTSNYTLNPGQNRDIEIRLKANEIGNFNVEGRVIYYFGENKTSAVIKPFKKPITVKSAGVIPVGTTTKPPEPSDGSSIIVGIIAIIAIIFTVYVIFNKIAKTFKNKLTKGKPTTEVHAAEVEIPQPPGVEEEPARIEPKIKKESAFEAEKRKQHSILPPEDLDIDTRNYLGSGVNTAISTLDAEIANAESDAFEVQGAIKKNEDVLGKLGTRLVNKEIGDQTYNDLKNKYMRKVSELKTKSAALESEAVKLKKIRSFIHEKGKYYT
ncbi:MAG: PsbP-related protein [Candidatus Methanoperedens sp.]|nr:PsbP-related protein [Candidatus Methanoperedens sp.]